MAFDEQFIGDKALARRYSVDARTIRDSVVLVSGRRSPAQHVTASSRLPSQDAPVGMCGSGLRHALGAWQVVLVPGGRSRLNIANLGGLPELR